MSRVPPTLTVRELRELLEEFKGTDEDELPVYACYNYGDYANTPAAQPIGYVEARRIEEEAYSHSGWGVAREPDEDEGADEEGPEPQGDGDEEEMMPRAMILSEHDYIPRGRR